MEKRSFTEKEHLHKVEFSLSVQSWKKRLLSVLRNKTIRGPDLTNPSDIIAFV